MIRIAPVTPKTVTRNARKATVTRAGLTVGDILAAFDADTNAQRLVLLDRLADDFEGAVTRQKGRTNAERQKAYRARKKAAQ